MAFPVTIPLGMSLPHRSPDAIDVAKFRRVARRAEALGFRDLWVTENALDHVTSFDPVSGEGREERTSLPRPVC